MKDEYLPDNPAISSNGMLGDIVCEWALKNKPERIIFCEITEYSSGNVLLNWRGIAYGSEVGEDGLFLSMRACKMYVTQHLTKVKSLWVAKNNIA